MDTCDKLHDARILTGEFLVQILDEYISILCFQIASVVGDDNAIVHIDNIAAKGEIIRTHLVADAGCFQRTASLIDFILVIAHDRTVGYL